MKRFSLAQVSQHARKGDLYMIYGDQVYDVTRFVEEHPGGEEVILDCSGKDGTAAFDEVGHSKDAHAQLRELLIGSLDQTSAETVEKARLSTKKVKKTPSNLVTLYSILVAIVVAALAAYLYSMEEGRVLGLLKPWIAPGSDGSEAFRTGWRGVWSDGGK
ncbi:Cytochrome b5-like Heme/Steroid binding domain-containing protein [Cladophialophora immunda]|nr:Cytochrome b5-like Heme/Steroid binding domain-containing protein [Cladophialophora immunda]